MKRILSLVLLISIISSMFAFAPAFAEGETEELSVYLYEDFVTGYTDTDKTAKNINGGLKRMMVNGRYMGVADLAGSGYQPAHYTKEVEVKDETKVVLEYKMDGFFYGGSNYTGSLNNYGVPTACVLGTTIKANEYADKEIVANCDINSGVTITVVYDNNEPTRDLFVDGLYINTYDMADKTYGRTYCDTGVLKLDFYCYLNAGLSHINYEYIKVYEAPSDYSRETFNPGVYKNVGKKMNFYEGSFTYSDSFYFDILNSLSFYSERDLGEYEENKPMTRLQFAGILAKIMNVSPAKEADGLYKDIARKHFMAPTLEALNKMGIMKGISLETFGVNATVTPAMVAAALVRALGYTEFAEYNSGYESGYLAMAKKIGLFKGVDISKELTQKDIMNIFCNFINTEIFEVVGVSSKGYIKEAKDGNTILKVYHNMVGIRDVLTGNQTTELTSPNALGEGLVKIGRKLLKTENPEINSYLGYEVEAYYNFDTDELIFAGVTQKNNVRIIDISDFESYKSGELLCFDGEKEYKLSLPVSADVIYNGKATTFDADLFTTLKAGKIAVIDNNNDGKYEVISISNFVNYVVDSNVTALNTLRFKGSKGVLCFDDYESYDVTNAENIVVDISKIGANSVVSVMESIDKTYVKVMVSTVTVVGSLDSYMVEDDYVNLTISDNEYVSDAYFNASYPYLNTGVTAEFWFDVFGSITYYEEIGTKSEGAGYILNMKPKGMYEDALVLKMITEYGELKVLDSAAKIAVDGGSKTSAASCLTNTQLFEQDGTFIPQLVLYELNGNGELAAIDTAYYNEGYENPENMLIPMLNSMPQTLQYNYLDNCFETNTYLGTESVAMVLPKESDFASATLKDYKIGSGTSAFKNENYYSIYAYKTSESALAASIIVNIRTDSTSVNFDSYSTPFVIGDVSNYYDKEEGIAVKKLKYWHNGKENSCYVDGNVMVFASDIYSYTSANAQGAGIDYFLNTVKKGDVAILSISDGKLMGVKHLSNGAVAIPRTGALKASNIHNATSGKIYKYSDNLIAISAAPEAANVSYEVHKVPSYVYVVDTQKGQIRTGDAGEIIDYLATQDASKCTNVVYYQSKGYDYGMIIYK